MLGERIKTIRIQKGYSQQTLAEQLNVVRQTVSKWEKELSVPDAEQLAQIAELLGVSVSELLGEALQEKSTETDNKEIARQLAIMNERFANQSMRRRKIIKIVVLIIVIGLLVTGLFYYFLGYTYRMKKSIAETYTTELRCTLGDEEYLYSVTYDDQYRILVAGGNTWIADHVQTEQYKDANILIAQIEDYFNDRGGSCERIEVTQEETE